MQTDRRRIRRVATVWLALLGLAGAGCGSGLSHQELLSANGPAFTAGSGAGAIGSASAAQGAGLSSDSPAAVTADGSPTATDSASRPGGAAGVAAGTTPGRSGGSEAARAATATG